MTLSQADIESPITPAIEELVHYNTAFALDLYQQLSSQSGNLFFSPYSIATALTMTSVGARGRTAQEMAEVLHISPDLDQLHPTVAALRSLLDSQTTDHYQLAIANRLWSQTDYPFLPDFLETMQEHYNSGLATVDFAHDTEAARQTINDWVEQQTNGKISELLSQAHLTPATRFVLTNAIYFNAQWSEPFNPEQTTEAPFTIAPGETISVPMMHSDIYSASYSALDTVQLLELFYGEANQSMVIALPQAVDGLALLEQQFTLDLLAKWFSSLDNMPYRDAPVSVTMPKFKVEVSIELNQALSGLGMSSAFSAQEADFSGMDIHLQPLLFLQTVIHKACLSVNEQGTEAAAATAIVGASRGGGTNIVAITIDHPFLLLIRDRISDSILFVGRVINPLE